MYICCNRYICRFNQRAKLAIIFLAHFWYSNQSSLFSKDHRHGAKKKIVCRYYTLALNLNLVKKILNCSQSHEFKNLRIEHMYTISRGKSGGERSCRSLYRIYIIIHYSSRIFLSANIAFFQLNYIFVCDWICSGCSQSRS